MTSLSSCAREGTAPGGDVSGVIIEPAVAVVSVGAQVPFTVTVLDDAGFVMHGRSIHWSIEDSSVIAVSSDGVITGHAIGSTQLAASAGGKSALAQVVVVQAAVASVRLTPGTLSLLVGQSGQLTAQALDAAGRALAGRPITWSSNNPSVAAVSNAGVVTARLPGGAIITATSEGRSAMASVTVLLIPVAGVVVTPEGIVGPVTVDVSPPVVPPTG